MKLYGTFKEAINETSNQLRDLSYRLRTEKWQGYDLDDSKPETLMHEILNTDFRVPLAREDLDYYRSDIEPNLPWADDHFIERVSGKPLNPGETWKDWPWSNKADHSRIFDGQFSHTYMERYWPKMAGIHPDDYEDSVFVNRGTRFDYGDLKDVINLLANQPNTRQAYLPIWFPEDTGAVHGNRVPCTLGYFFIQRNGFLHIHYPIRSCDFYRHFRDDLYLTTRLLLWVLEELRQRDSGTWKNIKPGMFSMWIGSLHLFHNDYLKLYGEKR